MDYDEHIRAAIDYLRKAAHFQYNDALVYILLDNARDHIAAALDLRDASR